MKRSRSPPPPFRQGDLDGFCGPYALINALRYLQVPGLTVDSGIALLQRILGELQPQRSVIRRLRWGSVFKELEYALEAVLGREHAISWSRPFKGRRGLTLEDFVAALDGLCRHQGGVALIGLWGARDHWTLVRRVTRHSLLLYDSHDLRAIRIASCSLRSGESPRRYRLFASHTLFIWLD